MKIATLRGLAKNAHSGCHCTPSSHPGADGIAKLSSGERYDVVTVDHYMPGQDGLEVMNEVLALPAERAESYR